jgi:drug/metabolite transporter (DMT)-like permease
MQERERVCVAVATVMLIHEVVDIDMMQEQAFLGWVFFGEPLPLGWWGGASLILLGLLLIHRSEEQRIDDKAVKQHKNE